jgi:hypothetical protein
VPLGIRLALFDLRETGLRRLEDIRLIAFDLEQVIVTEGDDDFGQIPLGIQRISSQQSQRWILPEQLAQMRLEHFRLRAFITRQRPLPQASLHFLSKHVEHLNRIARRIQTLFGRLAIDRRGQRRLIRHEHLQPPRKSRLKFLQGELGQGSTQSRRMGRPATRKAQGTTQ